MNNGIKIVMCAMFLIVLNSSVFPQSDDTKNSNASDQSEKIYKASEVTNRPVITFKPEAEYTSEARQNNVTRYRLFMGSFPIFR